MATDNTQQLPAAVAAINSLAVVDEQTSQEASPSFASTIPITSPEKLAQFAADLPTQPESNTVLYVAYGSNLSAETFLGARGIRPLSRVNVSVPTLELTFSLPGIPYVEPCFANVDYRKVPKNPPKIPDMPKVPPFNPPTSQTAADWDGGLIGVAYEVTKEDYSTIIRTEGGGNGYLDIIVPCVPLPPRMSVPEKPFPNLPKPFLAHTLYLPYIPDGKFPDDPKKKRWYRFLQWRIRPRPNPDYAEPSARYLKLITDGAHENELPEAYQRWLLAKRPYTTTTRRQKFAAAAFGAIGLLFKWIVTNGSKSVADKDGKFPKWFGVVTMAMFSIVWTTYDYILKPIFGDGERTQEPEDEKIERRRAFPCASEEKKSLLIRDW